MGKQKQQMISRFFAPKLKPDPSIITDSPPSPPPSRQNPTPPPKISATVSFSPAKRLQLSSPHRTAKLPKISHPRSATPTASSSRPYTTPRSLNDELSASGSKKYTPLEQQVVELKSKYKDVLLMIEVGYKYRFFGEDAEIAARVLGIYAHQDHNFITASIPTFRLHVHVRRLVNAGYKVGVVKQTETAAIKAHGSNRVGPFCRGLSALYTKATLEAAEEMGGIEEGFGRENHYLVCIVERSIDGVGKKVDYDVKIGFVAVEISTAEVLYGEFDDNSLRSGLEALVLSLSPAELLITNAMSDPTEKLLLAYCGPASNVRVERVQWNSFDGGGVLAEVVTSYENLIDQSKDFHMQEGEAKELQNPYSAIEVIMNMPDLAVQALALTIRHLKQFGFERILCLGASFRPFSANMEMTLSSNALQQLEILRNNADGSEAGSLLQIMNCTRTVYGSRLLRHWVAHPLCDRNMILARLDAVAEIADYMRSGTTTSSSNANRFDGKGSDMDQPDFSSLLSSVLTTLTKSIDLERGITRIFYCTATATEFIAVMEALLFAAKQLQRLYSKEDNSDKLQSVPIQSLFLRKMILSASSSSVIASAAKLLSTLNKKAAAEGNLSNLIIASNNQYPEVDRARKAVQLANDELDALIVLYRKQLGIQSLEFLSVSGSTHLIELPVDKRVPLEWVKVNSTKKTIRYHPPEVLTCLDRLALANEELMVACRAAWDNFLKGFSKYYADFHAAVQALAALDCLHSLALLSRNKNYTRPHFVKDDEPVQLQISCGRHPVLETILRDNFVPNDTNLHADGEICQIVTGPNMGGKSCYIRQVALIAIMAQIGSFVPASSAKLHVVDGIYTRMGASDSIQRGRSTYLEELSEASLILGKSTSRSLVIMDELGRGTSTHDGVAIAYATLHHLLEKKCMTLFVTHYPKIAEIQLEFPISVGAYHVSYLTTCSSSSSNHEGDVTYLYKLRCGISESSFGFKVAELAQVPLRCVNRAAVMAAKLEGAVRSRTRGKLMDATTTEKEGCFGGSDEEEEDLEELISRFTRIFSKLKKYALGGGGSDVKESSSSFQSLLDARNLAMEFG